MNIYIFNNQSHLATFQELSCLMWVVATVLKYAVSFLAHLTIHTCLFALVGGKLGGRHISLQGQRQGRHLAEPRPTHRSSFHFPSLQFPRLLDFSVVLLSVNLIFKHAFQDWINENLLSKGHLILKLDGSLTNQLSYFPNKEVKAQIMKPITSRHRILAEGMTQVS